MDVAVDILRDAAVALGHHGRVRGALEMPSTVAMSSEAPTPQLAPMATGWVGMRRDGTEGLGVMPIMVRPLVSKLMVVTMGRPACAAPSTAALSSSSDDMVSIQRRRRRPPSKPAPAREGLSPPRPGTWRHRLHDFVRWGRRSRQHRPGGPPQSASARAFCAAAMLISRTWTLRVVELQAVAVAAEGIGEHDIRPRLDEAAVQRAHPHRMLEIPHFRRVAGDEAHLEVVGARGAIG